MDEAKNLTVVDRNGARGNLSARPGELEGEPLLVELGRGGVVVEVPAGALVEHGSGTYLLRGDFEDFPAAKRARDRAPAVAAQGGETVVVPVIAEEVKVSRRVVETGRVRVSKRVSERVEVVDEPLVFEEVEVERVPVDRVVDGPLPVRYEGDTMIVPLFEEVLVVEKRLVLKEELRITKRRREERRPQEVTLRTEEARVERLEPRES